jgi:hypothetical protein
MVEGVNMEEAMKGDAGDAYCIGLAYRASDFLCIANTRKLCRVNGCEV